MEQLLMNIGLTDLQAKTYLWLLDNGGTTPPRLAKNLGITRTNTYKILDRLDEIGLVTKSDVKKKLTYFPQDPTALSAIVGEERNRMLALEENTKNAVFELRKKFNKNAAETQVKTLKGKSAVIDKYEQQAEDKLPLYFLMSTVDRSVMSFENMDYIRRLAAKHDFRRFGITQDTIESPINPELDKRSNLTRTWINAKDYTSPVEWSANENGLNIYIFDKEPSAISIRNEEVGKAFIQLWKLADKNIKANPEYKKLPLKAKREI